MKKNAKIATLLSSIVVVIFCASCTKDDAYSSQMDTQKLRYIGEKPETENSIVGKFLSAGISAVPAKISEDGLITSGTGVHEAYKCLVIISEDGASITLFEMERALPTQQEVLATFVKGEFSAEYTAAYDADNNGNWIPAIPEDFENGIQYKVGDKVVRSVLNETLANWNWPIKRGESYSTAVDGYTFAVSDGQVSITFEGQTLTLSK